MAKLKRNSQGGGKNPIGNLEAIFGGAAMNRRHEWRTIAVFLMIALLAVFSVPGKGSAETLDNWYQRDSFTTSNLNSVAYGNGVFVAVGDSGTIRTSADNKQ